MKNMNVADILNKVTTETQNLSDQRIPLTPHFWHSDSGRFYCSVSVVITNSADLEIMERLIQSFPEPDEARTTKVGRMTFVNRVYGKYPNPQGEVSFLIDIR